MPLVKGKKSCSKKNISRNIATEVRSGKKTKQAVAIAHSVCRSSRRGAP